MLTGNEARTAEPALSPAVGSAVRLNDQCSLNPPDFTGALATAVHEHGGELVEEIAVRDIRELTDGSVLVEIAGGPESRRDGGGPRCVTRRVGARWDVRRVVQAGRGYSFSVASYPPPSGRMCFPTQRLACTSLAAPAGPRLRIVGMMESPRRGLDHSPHRSDRGRRAAAAQRRPPGPPAR